MKQRSRVHHAVQYAKAWLQQHGLITIVPALIALGMLAYVADLAASARHHAAQLGPILDQTWLLILVLTPLYLAARALVWYRLLRVLNLSIPFRQLAVSFATGEMTKSLPAGVYIQNIVLGRLRHFGQLSLVRSSMATTAMLGLETVLALPVAMIVGVPGQPWLFWTLLLIVLIWLGVVAFAWIVAHHFAHRFGPSTPSLIRRLVVIADEFLHAGGELLTLETVRALIPTAVYMLIYTTYLYAIIIAAGIHNISFLDVMGIYALIVLAVVLVPIPTEIGITEFAGLGTLIAYGVPRPNAAVIMIALRILGSGATILFAGIIVLALRGELRAAQTETEPAQEARRTSTSSC